MADAAAVAAAVRADVANVAPVHGSAVAKIPQLGPYKPCWFPTCSPKIVLRSFNLYRMSPVRSQHAAPRRL